MVIWYSLWCEVGCIFFYTDSCHWGICMGVDSFGKGGEMGSDYMVLKGEVGDLEGEK